MFLPIAESLYSKALYLLFSLSICLLPFSTGGGRGNHSESNVITFAFPFLIFLSISIVFIFIINKKKFNHSDEIKFTVFCATLHVFSIFITSLLNSELIIAFSRSIFHFVGFSIFLYIISNFNTRKNAALVYERISILLIVSGCLMSAYFIVNFGLALQDNSLEQVLLERENGGSMSLPWGATNTIAACLMMPLFLAVERFISLKPIEKVDLMTKKIGLVLTRTGLTSRQIDFAPKQANRKIVLAAIITIVVAILITQSRSAIFCSTLGLIAIGILTKNIKFTFIFVIATTLAISIVGTIYAQDLDMVFAARVGDQAQDVGGFNGRTLLWDISVAYFLEHALQPVGYFGMLAQLGHTAHNIFLTTAIEQGIFGLGAYLLFLINNFSFCIKKISYKYFSFATKRTMTIYLIAMLAILMQLQFEDAHLTSQNVIYQWLFLSLMYLSAYRDVSAPVVLPARDLHLRTFLR
jgi:O-antigen ligase